MNMSSLIHQKAVESLTIKKPKKSHKNLKTKKPLSKQSM